MAMRSNREGRLEIEQGALYWKHEISSQPASNDQPTLLFIHARVSDHALWNAQVAFFVDGGWDCLRYYILGYGKSEISENYLQSSSRTPVDHVGLIDQLVTQVLAAVSKVIPIGLSIGGGLALSYTVFYPDQVAAAAVIAGGVRGVDIPNTQAEDQVFEEADVLLKAGDTQRYAESRVRIRGDGPLQKQCRIAKHLREKMLSWNLVIATREIAGKRVDSVRREPAPATKLDEIKVPVGIAYGALDETNTTEMVKYIGEMIAGAEVMAFETAHMVNLEAEEEFNEWLGGWLDRHFSLRGK